MTNRSELEQALDRYLAEGGEQVPDRVVDAALDQIDHTSQRLALRVPWRFPDMPYFLKSAMAATAVIAVLIVGGVLLTRGPTTSVGGPPAASSLPSVSTPASAGASPSATPALTDTSNWIPFTSERYGYEIEHPPTWIATPATGDWDFETSRLDWETANADTFLSAQARFSAFASDVPADMSEDEWIAAYYEGSVANGVQCEDFVDWQPISVDGYAGRLAVNDACFDVQAFVFVDTRVHVFAIWRENHEALLEAFLSTVEFQP
jgi:hypothetical protein